MHSTSQDRPHIASPSLIEVNSAALCLESILSDLPLHHFEIEAQCLGTDLAEVFEQHPGLPGAILFDQQKFLGLISRQCLLEYLIRPQGLDLFLTQPLRTLHSYARNRPLILPDDLPIMAAAQKALRRSLPEQGEPIVVKTHSNTYYLLNAHELNIAYWQIRGIETQVRYERTQVQLIQTEKMASLGRLVDGVAHEILDPVSFIWGNLAHVSTYAAQLMEVFAAYEAHFPEVPEPIAELASKVELDYLQEDLPRTLNSIQTGAERLKKLVTSLQNFCHIDEVHPKPANLHDCLDSIILLLKSRLTGEIQVLQNYGQLPPVSCYSGQLTQVFMNILTNAVDALLDQAVRETVASRFANPSGAAIASHALPKPQITITTQIRTIAPAESAIAPTRWVSIRIADNGPGLTPAQRQKILESFSVEKRAAKETSLSVSYHIVTAKHGGKLYVRSPIEPVPDPVAANPAHLGTEFEILLPLV